MICGIDLSTKALDFVAINEDNPAVCEHRRVPLSGEWWQSARNMRQGLAAYRIPQWLEDNGVHLVGVERPYGRQIKAVAALYTVMGALLASLPSRVLAFEVSPADMRRELGLPGNCAKDTLHVAVFCHIDRSAAAEWPPDAYDAWAAGHAALQINDRATKEAT
jgi:hypothetical protein